MWLHLTGGVVTIPVNAPEESTNLMERYPYLLWIIIACVAAVTIIAISVFLGVICMRRKKSAETKAQNKSQARQGPDVTKPAPPDLWIDHERVSSGP